MERDFRFHPADYTGSPRLFGYARDYNNLLSLRLIEIHVYPFLVLPALSPVLMAGLIQIVDNGDPNLLWLTSNCLPPLKSLLGRIEATIASRGKQFLRDSTKTNYQGQK